MDRYSYFKKGQIRGNEFGRLLSEVGIYIDNKIIMGEKRSDKKLKVDNDVILFTGKLLESQVLYDRNEEIPDNLPKGYIGNGMSFMHDYFNIAMPNSKPGIVIEDVRKDMSETARKYQHIDSLSLVELKELRDFTSNFSMYLVGKYGFSHRRGLVA